MPHWKHTATRCAMPDCERTRRKGWTTCALFGHAERGVSLYGLAPKAPRLLPEGAAAREAERFEAMAASCAIPAQAAECRRLAALARNRAIQP